MDTLLQDIRYAIRALIKRPGFTAVVVIALALGIGANTAIFSVVNTVLLKPLPYKDADRLVSARLTDPQSSSDTRPITPVDFTAWRQQSALFEQMGYSRDTIYSLTGRGEPETIIGYRFSANFFDVLGVPPLLGRTFTAEEDRPDANKVVVLSHKLWQRLFGGDPNIIGQAVTLNGQPFTVIGVMPPEFRHPQRVELWTPIALSADDWNRHNAFVLRVIGRLKPGVTVEQAKSELDRITATVAEQHPDTHAGRATNVTSMRDDHAGDVRPALLVLLAAVGFVLLIACANIANLLLARAASRHREIAIRTALGASRTRLIRQFLTESMVLAGLGGALGVLLALWGAGLLVSLFPNNISNLNIPRVEEIPVDLTVFGFALLLSLLTGLIFGLAPALQSSKPDLNEALKEGGRSGMTGPRGGRLRSLLVISEVALSLILLVGAGLLIKSFLRLQSGEFGFNPTNVLTAQLSLPQSQYREPQKRRAFVRDVLERIRNTPGVESVGATEFLPLTGFSSSTSFKVEGRPTPAPGEEPQADYRLATEGYFTAMGIQIMRGRDFKQSDNESSQTVLIINEKLAARFFDGEDPIGKRLDLGEPGKPDLCEIVGVIKDIKPFGLSEETPLTIFLPYDQAPFQFVSFAIRTGPDPASLVSAVKSAVWSVDPGQPFFSNLITMEQLAGESITLRRVSMLLLSAMAGLALALAALGIYGVISYSVNERTHEIGIRLALGANRRDVLKLIAGRGMLLTALGIGIGLVVSVALTRFMSTMLYDVQATDPLTFLLVALALSAVALGACFVPAYRATRVDPMVALRYE